MRSAVGVVSAHGGNAVLRLQHIHQLLHAEAEVRQFAVGKLDGNALVLFANAEDFGYILDQQQFLADAVRSITQLGKVETVTRQGKDIAVSFTEFVVVKRALHALWQGAFACSRTRLRMS